MVRFEELQSLWQKQAPLAGSFDTGPVLRALRRYSRRQQLIQLTKVLLISGLFFFVRQELQRSVWSLCGIAVIAAGVAAIVIGDWRRQRAIANLNFAEPSAAFLQSAIEQVRQQRDAFRDQYWLVVLTAGFGINLLYLGMLRESTILHRVLMHLFASVLPFGACAVGTRVRARRFEAECRPLLDRLIEMQKASEERSQ